MNKLNIYNLLIEITRECNLTCQHCLRGEQEIGTIQNEHLWSLFSQIDSISILTLTGGEPALYPEIIQKILSIAKAHQIDIGNFYIATNGTIASNEFIKVLMDLWLYCSENAVSGVDVSNDIFHDQEWEENYEKLSILRFVGKKYNKDGHDYGDYKQIIAEGYGKDWGNNKHTNITIQDILKDGNIDDLEQTLDEIEFYLNCEGNIIIGCDLSYESQREPKNILCSVKEFTTAYEAFFNKLTLKEKINVCD